MRTTRKILSRGIVCATVTIRVALFDIGPASAAYPAAVEGTRIAVATEHEEATLAAIETLQAGGNAIDGAITAMTVLGVVSPASSGLGGGGFAIVYMAKDAAFFAVDFREMAPVRVDRTELEARTQKRFDAREEAHRGVSVGVPGEPAGIEWLSLRFAKRPLSANIAAAIRYAEEGFINGRYLASLLPALKPRLASSPELFASYEPGGVPLPFRARVVRPELARTLKRFGATGADLFYKGDIGEQIIKAVNAAGGAMDANDLLSYRARERTPLQRVIDGRMIVTAPAPSAGGLMLSELLTMFGVTSKSSLSDMGFGSSAYLHELAEAMRGALSDRAQFAGDPDAQPGVLAAYDKALDPKKLLARRAQIRIDRTRHTPEYKVHEHGTSHLIVADAEGNIVSLTTTVNEAFGARIVAGDSGVILNNELDDFSFPVDLVGFSTVDGGPNRPRPLARPVTSMTPTLIFEGGKPILAVGGSGGQRIATGVTQAVLARLIFNLDPAACVSAPRIHLGVTSQDLFVDPYVAKDIRAGLTARGEQVTDEVFVHSGIQMVAWERDTEGTRILAASDPRKEGFAAAR